MKAVRRKSNVESLSGYNTTKEAPQHKSFRNEQHRKMSAEGSGGEHLCEGIALCLRKLEVYIDLRGKDEEAFNSKNNIQISRILIYELAEKS